MYLRPMRILVFLILVFHFRFQVASIACKTTHSSDDQNMDGNHESAWPETGSWLTIIREFERSGAVTGSNQLNNNLACAKGHANTRIGFSFIRPSPITIHGNQR